MRRARLTLLLMLVAPGWACNVDSGDLTVSVVKSWLASQDPFLDAEAVRVRVDGPGLLVGPKTFKVKDRRGALADVPLGDNRQVTVEGLGYEGNPVSRGRTRPLTIREGNNAISLYVGRLEDNGVFSYTPVKQLLQPRAYHSATLLEDGSVLIAGGITTSWTPENTAGDPLPSPTGTMERIDGDSLTVRLASPSSCTTGAPRCMVTPRAGHTATLLESGNVLLAGGSDGAQPVERVEIFSPEDNRFVRAGPLKSPRVWHRAVASGGGALLVGGEGSAGLNLPGELFSSGQLDSKPGLQQGRRAFTLTRLDDGTLVAAGGIDRNDNVLDTIELLPPGSPAWKTSTARMTTPRAHHSATLLEDGTILFVGGLTSLAGQGDQTATIERFDPVKESAAKLSSALRAARWGHTATRTTDGRVLVVGGFSGNRNSPPSRLVEQVAFFEGGLTQVRTLANLREARAGHSATLLRSGLLLVVGGVSSSTTVSRTAEVYVY